MYLIRNRMNEPNRLISDFSHISELYDCMRLWINKVSLVMRFNHIYFLIFANLAAFHLPPPNHSNTKGSFTGRTGRKEDLSKLGLPCQRESPLKLKQVWLDVAFLLRNQINFCVLSTNISILIKGICDIFLLTR